jgi:hypothetical protein
MKLVVKRTRWLIVIALSWGIVACSDNTDLANVSTPEAPSARKISLDVYKSRTCGCCKKWVSHVKNSGFQTDVHHPTNLNKLKADKGVLPRYQSCHTAVSQDGYVFEGHIPADIIQRFLTNPPPNAIGLAVPGMPVGSPGMEMGNRHDEYDVLLLSSDGSNTVYEHIGGKR